MINQFLLSVSSQLDICEVVGVGQQNNYAIRVVRLLDGFTVKCHDDLAGLDLVANCDLVVEAFAVHGNCIDADVDQNFKTCVIGNTDRMLGICNSHDLAVERSKYNALSGINTYAFAQDAGSECVIRNVSLCYNSTDRGSNDLARMGAGAAAFLGSSSFQMVVVMKNAIPPETRRTNVYSKGLLMVRYPGIPVTP